MLKKILKHCKKCHYGYFDKCKCVEPPKKLLPKVVSTKEETADKMLRKKIPFKMIAFYTGLTIEKVKEMSYNIRNEETGSRMDNNEVQEMD